MRPQQSLVTTFVRQLLDKSKIVLFIKIANTNKCRCLKKVNTVLKLRQTIDSAWFWRCLLSFPKITCNVNIKQHPMPISTIKTEQINVKQDKRKKEKNQRLEIKLKWMYVLDGIKNVIEISFRACFWQCVTSTNGTRKKERDGGTTTILQVGNGCPEIESDKLSELLRKKRQLLRELLCFGIRKYSFQEETLKPRILRYVNVQKWIRNESIERWTECIDTLHRVAHIVSVSKVSSPNTYPSDCINFGDKSSASVLYVIRCEKYGTDTQKKMERASEIEWTLEWKIFIY